MTKIEDEPLSKAELRLIERIVGVLGLSALKSRLWSKVQRAFNFTYHHTQVSYGFAHATPDERALKYLEERVFILSDKTRDRLTGDLRWELLEGMRNAESIDEIKRRLDTVFDGSDVNTERIARTETLNAMAEGRYQANVESGLADYKQWRAAMKNARTAADSKRLNGQIQKIGDPFVDPKTGDTCMHNPNRPNCRCTVLYLLKLPPIVMKDGLMYAADEVGKLEIDIGSLQKIEKKIWVKATAKRKGHYRKIKGAKLVEKDIITNDYTKSTINIKEYINGLNKTYDGRKIVEVMTAFTGSSYRDIKEYMKDPSQFYNFTEDDKIFVENQIASIDKFLTDAPKFSGKTYIGLQYNIDDMRDEKTWNNFINSITNSDEVAFNTFISSSSDMNVAKNFASDRFEEDDKNVKSCLINLKVKSGVAIEEISKAKSEKEVLLNSDITYKIIRFDDSDSKYVILDLEEI